MSTIQVTNINDLSDNAALVTDNGGIKTDKLTGKTTAGSIAVTGEGNSTTTNLQQGLAKAWGDCTHEAAITDSLNLSGGVDNGVGDYTYSFTNNMAAGNYSIPINVGYASLISFDNNEQTTSSYNLRLFTRADSLTAADATNHSTLHGDLA